MLKRKHVSLFALMLLIVAATAGCAPPGGWGSITIETDPPGATITFRGEEVGITPKRLTFLPLGEFEAIVEKRGHFPSRTSGHITSQSELTWTPTLIPKPGFVDRIDSPRLLSQIFWAANTHGAFDAVPLLWSKHTSTEYVEWIVAGMSKAWGDNTEAHELLATRFHDVDFEIDEISPNLVVSRPRRGRTRFESPTHLLMLLEKGSWKVLLTGEHFEKDGYPLPFWWQFVNLKEALGLDSLIPWTITRTLGKTTNAKQDRLVGYTHEDKTLRVALNGGLTFGVTNAYLKTLTSTAKNTFAEDAAKVVRDLFLIDPSTEEVIISFYVPMFIDDYGTVEQRYVGYVSMTRETYERVNWDSIRLDMVAKLLDSHWLY